MRENNLEFAEYCVQIFNDKTMPHHLAVIRDHCKDQLETTVRLK